MKQQSVQNVSIAASELNAGRTGVIDVAIEHFIHDLEIRLRSSLNKISIEQFDENARINIDAVISLNNAFEDPASSLPKTQKVPKVRVFTK